MKEGVFMIESYEILEKNKPYTRVSIYENNRQTIIACKDSDPLQASIIWKNEKEILVNKKKSFQNNLKFYKKAYKKYRNEAIFEGTFIPVAGVMAIYTLVSAVPIFSLVFASLGVASGIILKNTLKDCYESRNIVQNLHTLINNIDMMITRNSDIKYLKNRKVKQEYFEEDKYNNHITYVCVDKIVRDQEQSVSDRWYGLNHDKCARMVRKKAKKSVTLAKLEEVFYPINTNNMETKRYVKSIMNGHGKSR